jgi:hypothetical protein
MKNFNVNSFTLAASTALVELGATLVRKGILSPEDAALSFQEAARQLAAHNKDATTDMNMEASEICKHMAESVGNVKPE